jgi:hypothetical protein
VRAAGFVREAFSKIGVARRVNGDRRQGLSVGDAIFYIDLLIAEVQGADAPRSPW